MPVFLYIISSVWDMSPLTLFPENSYLLSTPSLHIISSWKPSPCHWIWVVVVQSLSHVWLLVTLWTVTNQDPLFMIFQTRILLWVPFPSPEIFLDQGLNLCLLYWQADSLPLSYQKRKWKWKTLSGVWLFAIPCSLPSSSVHGILQARILEWVAILFCKGSFRPKDRSWVPALAGRFLAVWATREAHFRWW